MKKLFFTLLLSMTAALLYAQPLWMRYPAISPDGSKIAFCYKGDIYSVSSSGGKATQLTTGSAYESNPVWSPNSGMIAFSSNRNGNNDVFVMPSTGGEATRLTTDSYGEVPTGFTPKGDAVLFTCSRNTTASSVNFPSGVFQQTYKVSVKGGRPEVVVAAPSERTIVSKDGSKVLYHDIKGVENKWRKHHTSSITRDIVIYDTKSGSYKMLTTNNGEDRDPVFSSDEKKIYYLSEVKGGTFNVYSMNIDGSGVTKVSDFKTHPVRFLSTSKDDLLCYGFHGELYTQKVGSSPKKVKVEIINDTPTEQMVNLQMKGGVQSVAVSQDGSQIAFVIRGEVFVTSVDYGTTKRITSSIAAERGVSFSPDGRTLIYASDREDGVWNIYSAKIAREADIDFANATLIEEKPLFKKSNTDRFSPEYSPDGKEIAFIQDRNKLMVYNIASGKTRTVTNGEFHYRNDINGFTYQWSPNSKWFVMEYVANGHDPYNDIGIVSANGGEVTNLTESGYMSGGPRWALDGNAVIFQTERYGMRNHASWGSLNDIMIAFVNQDAYDKFRLSKNEYDLMKAEEKRFEELQKKNAPKTDDKAKKDSKKPEAPVVKAKEEIEMELSTITDRIVRLTKYSANLGDAIVSNDGSKMYYNIGSDLYEMNLRNGSSKVLQGGVGGSFFMDKGGKNLFVLGGGSFQKIGLQGGNKSSVAINAIMNFDLAAERAYMLDFVYTQELKRFYVEDLHGVNWKAMRDAYAPLLKDINNNYDFAELLSEILGELNVSHTGASYAAPSYGDNVAELGLFFDENYKKDGLMIEEVIVGSPFNNAKSKVKKGVVIEKIDGTPIKAGMDYYPLLNNKSGQRILVSLRGEDGSRWDEIVKPFSKGALNSVLYNRWVKWQAAEVERLSGGKLGYIHIKSMSDEYFRTLYSDILGKYNKCEGIVIDTRHNGGGRMHEDIEIIFSGEKYLTQVVRGREACDMPSRRWNKPSIMLICEDNYSNAHGTPWVYSNRKIGKLVGMPVPGTMTSVNWEKLQDASITFGIPVIGYRTSEGYYLENFQLEPDVKVRNTPEKFLSGRDEQLEAAVVELLKEVKTTNKK